MKCPACGTDNDPGRKFCGECGGMLARTCQACGSANPPGAKFCGECGSALAADTSVEAVAAPAAEGGLGFVLFADLVGFTWLAESRDGEEVRELLSTYFERGKRLIDRDGG